MKATYFYQMNRRTWMIMDRKYWDGMAPNASLSGRGDAPTTK